jgi:hypothetical protein
VLTFGRFRRGGPGAPGAYGGRFPTGYGGAAGGFRAPASYGGGMAPAQGAPYGYPAQGGVNPQSYYAGAAMAAVPGAYGAYGGAAAPAGGVQPGYGKWDLARNAALML